MRPAIADTMSMDEIMRTWPATINVLIRHHMLCVGCPIASFHTIADACREHGIDQATLMRDIERQL